MIAVPDDPQQFAYMRYRALTDTGAMCRTVLGWDYDEDEKGNKVNIGTGGVRDNGTYLKVTKFLDDPNEHYKLLMTPRGSYKSTKLQGRVCREIALDPDTRILYLMKTQAKALEKAEAIRKSLESERFVQFFGQQQGDLWTADKLTVCGRTKTNLQEPTFSVYSLESLPTGGHYNHIFVDDLIDTENCRTKQAIEYSKKILRLLFPLLVNGGYLYIVGTMYAEDDFYHDVMSKQVFDKLVLGAGVRVLRTDGGGFELIEDPAGLTFPHLTVEKLRVALELMSSQGSFYEFSCQYLNEVPSGFSAAFTREMFRPARWDPVKMRNYTGYLLTDTATSMKDEGCYSVALYVLLDEEDNVYLADQRVGHMRPQQFADAVFELMTHWSSRVNHVGEGWEDISLTTVFQDMLAADARAKKLRLNPITVPRQRADTKFARIERLESKFAKRKFYVLDTVPRTFQDIDGERVFYDPEGYKDARTYAMLPGGELVEELVRLRAHPKTDVADALAMIVETNRQTGVRYFTYRQPSKKRLYEASSNQRETDFTQAAQAPMVGESWWAKTLRGINNDR